MPERDERTPAADEAAQSLALALVAARTHSDVVAAVADHASAALGCSGTVRLVDAAAVPLDCLQQSASVPLSHILLLDGSTLLGALKFEPSEPQPDSMGRTALTALLSGTLSRIRKSDASHLRAIKEAAELRFDVVSMLSHEMRTPLTSIKGYASALLLEEAAWDHAATVEFLQSIEAEADHLTKLVADILEATAIEAGDLRLELEPVLMTRVAKRVVDKVAIRGAGHRFVLMFPPDFPIVEADPHRIEQVLTNLIDNAVKFSPDGGMVLVRGASGAGEVVVSVVDQGMGIAPEHLNKLFERFFRAVPDHRKRIVGTGLGLPIADAIVRAHGGRIWASSVVGSGTTLSFSLPHPRAASTAVTA